MSARWFRRLLTLLLWLLIAAAIAGWIYSRRVLPQTEGSLSLPGLGAELRIERDGHGIPTIRAASVRDAMFGLGVVHAQDRLWQMETHRRIGAGRLAEAFGEGALDTDKFIRILGVRRAAAAQWAQIGPAGREALTAYAAGVNAVIAQLKARPPEFMLLGLQPEPWTPQDSLSWAIMMALDLGANWQAEVLRLRLAMQLPKARIDELMPPYAGDPVPATQDYAAFYRSLKLDARQAGRTPPDAHANAHASTSLNANPNAHAGLPGLGDAQLQRLLALAPESEIDGLGSNSWVLAGTRSSTGAPLLASDPHLKLSAPALWYFARIVAPGLDVAGASMPGLPSIVMGQNAHIAWGFTNTGPDVQDTYLERLHASDPTQYQTPEGWARFETRQEQIAVRGGVPVSLTVRSTRHGPVVSDAAAAGVADEALGPKGRPGYVLALRWTGLDTDQDIVATSLAMMAATSVEAFVQASSTWVAPMQNMAVADREGHIALVSPGRVPRRQPDNDLQGLAPAPGWDARYDWAGNVPVAELPQVRDPAKGYVANANQKITPPGYPHFISHQWALPFRHQRIEQMIDAKPRHSLDDLAVMHGDIKSLAAARLLPRLLQARSSHPLAGAALQALQGFDGTMAADKAAPLIFWAWNRQLSQRVLADEVGAPIYERMLGQRGYFDALEGVLARDDGWWCDDKATPAVEGCAEQVNAAFSAALDELQALQGADVAAWQWGRAHQARSEHRPFSRVKLLARWFELRQPVGGDTYTVNVSRVGLRADATTGEFYLDEHGPSLRGLYDLGDRGRSRIVHSTGQSGIPWSPQYRSLADTWRQVGYVPLFPPAGGSGWQTLVLQPAR
ncbi:penicillin acylase family protein [Aquabacterium sp. OR-4]|uniref:penicillin acylase family protein n=1 Tax=Aquabacterium sp. OR-4 TaxID=2978127 RepID=UPI0021B1B57B|nr:penicillin acylase family protein [Aquabacterium sp. OR-4]MDT7834904.1 penicillin acylase family protein [Aquabacterium sp. OR-4]